MRNGTGMVAALAAAVLGACQQPAGPGGGAAPAVAPRAAADGAHAGSGVAAGRGAGAAGNRLACGGPFGPGTTLASLKAAFGDRAVREEELTGPEGMTYPGIVIHGDDPARRIEVALTVASADGPSFGSATVRGGASSWALASGITVGSAFADVVGANGGPFQLSGLGWDYGGFVSDWQGGALAGDATCRVQIRFGLPDEAGDIATSILGDTLVSSTDPGFAGAGITVSEAGIAWQEPGPKD